MKIIKDKKVLKMLLIAAIVVTIVGFLVDLKATFSYPGTDLRNRVVGARLMLEGIDPYFFKWQPGLSEKFYDPLEIPTELLSKLSVPPTVLVLHSLFAKLSYLQQKIIWLGVQWAALIGTILVFIKTSSSSAKTNLILMTSFLFVSSLFWRFHVNSGQIYIVYVLLLSIAWLSLKKQSNTAILLSGVLVGITVSLRPSFLLFFVAFAISRKYLFVLGGVLGTLGSFTLSLPVVGISIWQKYFLTMLKMTGFIDLDTYLSAKEIPSNLNIVYPQIVEGFDWKVRNPLEYYLDNTSLYDVLNAIDIPHKRYVLVIGFVATMIFLSVYIWNFSRKNDDIELIFLWGALTCFIGEFFIPVGRFSYYDVQILIPLLIIIDKADIGIFIYQKNIVILLLGFLLSIVGFIVVPRAMFFSTFLIWLYIILVSFMLSEKYSKKIGKVLTN